MKTYQRLLILCTIVLIYGVVYGEGLFFDNDDGTVNDGISYIPHPSTPKFLMWTKNANPAGVKMSYSEAQDYLEKMNKGEVENFGYTDWRMPSKAQMSHHLGLEYSIIPPMKTLDGLPENHPFENYESKSTYWSQTMLGSFDPFLLLSDDHYLWPVRVRRVGTGR